MFAFSRGNHFIQCSGSITNSSIDMNGSVITNNGTPINPTDSVNKAYVDASSAGVTSVVTLTGLAFTTISSVTSGVVTVSVKNIVANGPSSIFYLVKSESTSTSIGSGRTAVCPGLNTAERLMIRWLTSSGIELRKSGTGYNGTYRVTIVVN